MPSLSVPIRKFAPGLLFVCAVTYTGFIIHWKFETVSPLVASLVLGALVGNIVSMPKSFMPGQKFAAKKVLRFGIVLLGTQLALKQVIDLGGRELIVVVGVVALTFLGTLWLGPRLGVSKSLSLLIATGFSICGASAVAAIEGVVEADEEEVTYAIALVTLCGSLAIVLLPLLRNSLGLSDPQLFGSWVGASVHDVAQVIATSSTGGETFSGGIARATCRQRQHLGASPIERTCCQCRQKTGQHRSNFRNRFSCDDCAAHDWHHPRQLACKAQNN
jgi:uncharacterized integral membrane protein (TIGR00698 family)